MTEPNFSVNKSVGLFQRVFRLLKNKEKKTFIFLVFLNVILGGLELTGLISFLPIIMALKDPKTFQGKVWWDYLQQFSWLQDYDHLMIFLLISAIFIYLVKALFSIWLNRLFVKFSLKVSERFSEQMLQKLVQIPLLDFQGLPTGKSIRSVIFIPQYFAKNILLVILMWISELLIAFIIFLGLLFYKPLLLLLLLATMGGTSILFLWIYRRNFKALGLKESRIQDSMIKDVIGLMSGLLDWRLLGKENFIVKNIQSKIKKSYGLNIDIELAKSLPNLMIEVTVLLSILVIFIYGSINGSEPKFWINLLAIYALAAFRIMPSVKRIMSYITRIRLFDYTIPQIEEIQNKIKKTENNPIEFNDRIQFNNVSFSHEKSMFKILDSIHFDLVKGSCMGIFGASGTGKTTFLHILMGLIPPKSGSVEIDGTTHTHPGGIFAYVRQDVFVLEGSLVQNIALGVPDEEIDYELIEYCLHWSSLKKWVSNLPEGIYRPLSESGKNMSGGEKQRMAIARALYAQAEILIFDEPIGSLDPDNAQQILDAISFLKESGKTIVIVSHQPEALVHCNQIFELNKGKLIPQ